MEDNRYGKLHIWHIQLHIHPHISISISINHIACFKTAAAISLITRQRQKHREIEK